MSRTATRNIAIALLCAGAALFFYGRIVWDQYLRTLPRMMDAQTKHVYPLNIHGIVVFQTEAERNWLWLFDRGGFAVLVVGLAVGAYSKRLNTET